MARYPVRCCCEPTKLYGYLELPDGLRSGSETVIRERVSYKMPAFNDLNLDAKPNLVPDAPHHSVKLMRVVDHAIGLDEIAVYSDDRPIEFWRRIVGFSEWKPAPFTFHTIDPSVISECGQALGKDRVVTLDVEGPIADRRVSGRVKAIKFDSRNCWHDITIEEMVASG